MTTTNGTRAILASREAKRVYIASFTNLRATSDEISVQFLKKDHGHSVHIICAGTEGHISLEDSLLAGALTSQIVQVTDLADRSKFRRPFRQRRSVHGGNPVARGRALSRKTSFMEVAERGAGRAECVSNRAETRYRRGRPLRPVQSGCRAATRLVENRGRLMRETERSTGRAMPRSCLNER